MGPRLVVFVDESDSFFDEKFRLWTWRKDISRYREFKADAEGARLAGREKMIGALKRLMANTEMVESHHESLATLKINGRRGWAMFFSTHPPLQKRISALEVNS